MQKEPIKIDLGSSGVGFKYSVVVEDPKTFHVQVVGVLDTYNSTSFYRAVESIMKDGAANVVLDCRGINYASSTGVGSFMSIHNLMRKSERRLALYGVAPIIRDVFSLLGFSTFLFCVESYENALDHVMKKMDDSIFPKVGACPICTKRLRFPKSGRFRCGTCKTILSVSERGSIYLG